MAIQRLLYLYILFVASVSIVSYKKGIYLIWITLLFVPTIILEQIIKMRFSMLTILLLCSVISELRFGERRTAWKEFISNNQRAIIIYLFISFTIVFLSQTVPLSVQLMRLIEEITMLLFALQTFFLARNNEKSALAFKYIICGAIVYNIVYSIYFELILRVNPAGMPLYILLGQEDNDFIVDMIDTERGGFDLRAQTVYRHPLSLGQYMLVLLPLFLMKGKYFSNLFFSFLICALIILSGSRGAMAPMVLILFISMIKSSHINFRKLVVLFAVIIAVISSIPDKQRDKFTKEVEPFVAGLAFWDDEKQEENDVSGSSMEMRFDQINAAFVEIEENPIFGRGYGYRDYWIFLHNDLHPELLGFESVFLLYLVERGWIGLIFFFFIVYYIYRLCKNETISTITILLVFVGYLTSIIMTGVRPLTLLFVCLAYSVTCGIAPHKEKEKDSNPLVESLPNTSTN